MQLTYLYDVHLFFNYDLLQFISHNLILFFPHPKKKKYAIHHYRFDLN